jgi:hypothetical protein
MLGSILEGGVFAALELHYSQLTHELLNRESAILKILIAIAEIIPLALLCPNNKEGRLYNLFIAGGASSACEWGMIVGIIDIIILILLCLIVSGLNHTKKISH